MERSIQIHFACGENAKLILLWIRTRISAQRFPVDDSYKNAITISKDDKSILKEITIGSRSYQHALLFLSTKLYKLYTNIQIISTSLFSAFNGSRTRWRVTNSHFLAVDGR
jgi:hypothetical protein